MVAGHQSWGLLVRFFGLFFALVAGLLLMLLQLRFGIPPAVANGLRLLSSGMAVFPLPGMIIHPGPGRGLFVMALLFSPIPDGLIRPGPVSGAWQRCLRVNHPAW